MIWLLIVGLGCSIVSLGVAFYERNTSAFWGWLTAFTMFIEALTK